MRDSYRNYLELVENGRPLDQELTSPDIRRALLTLNRCARESDGLTTESAWRLDRRECRRLERSAGFSPPEGWAALAGLACGCGVLEALEQRFRSVITFDSLTEWSERMCRRRLVESFTRRLVPPSSAAGLFILLGIHPAWGLRLAHEVASGGASAAASGGSGESILRPGWRDSTVFPEGTLAVLRSTTFGAIAAIFETLGRLDSGQKYPTDALSAWIGEVCASFRALAQEQLRSDVDGGVPAFLSASGMHRVQSSHRMHDFTTGDLLDSVLVPAGVLRRFDDGTFCLAADVSAEISIGEMNEEERQAAMSWALAGEEGFMVA